MLPFVQGSVLDLGCGAAEILDFLPDGTRYVGVDSHPEVIGWLDENKPGHTYLRANIETDGLTLADQFDTILMLALLEHLEDPIGGLRFAPKLCQADGAAAPDHTYQDRDGCSRIARPVQSRSALCRR